MKKVTLVGGGGYLGSRITDEILREQKDIVIQIIDRSINYKFNQVEYVKSDIINLSKERLIELLKDSTDVFLMNGVLFSDSQKESRKVRYDNYFSLIKIAKIIRKDQKIHFFSSQAVFGGVRDVDDLTENKLASPVSNYAKYKVWFECFLMSGQFDYIIYRLATCFGFSKNYDSITFLNQLYKSSLGNGAELCINSGEGNKVSALSVTYLSHFIIHILMNGTEEKLLHVVSDNKTIKEYSSIFNKYFPVRFNINSSAIDSDKGYFINTKHTLSSWNVEDECLKLSKAEIC